KGVVFLNLNTRCINLSTNSSDVLESSSVQLLPSCEPSSRQSIGSLSISSFAEVNVYALATEGVFNCTCNHNELLKLTRNFVCELPSKTYLDASTALGPPLCSVEAVNVPPTRSNRLGGGGIKVRRFTKSAKPKSCSCDSTCTIPFFVSIFIDAVLVVTQLRVNELFLVSLNSITEGPPSM